MGDPARKPDPEDLADDLDEELSEEEWGAAWEAEIDRRIENARRTGDKGVSWDEMAAEIRAKYGWT
jgi:putative addiction module component (TIGR02574 family)